MNPLFPKYRLLLFVAVAIAAFTLPVYSQTVMGGDTMVYIGKETDAIGRYFSGKLDDIGIWNRALTHTEISRLFDSNQ